MTAKPKPAFTWDQIEALRRDAGLSQDDCPSNAFTVRDYAEKVNVPRHIATHEIDRMFGAGKLKRGRAYRPGTDGRQSRVWVYWPA